MAEFDNTNFADYSTGDAVQFEHKRGPLNYSDPTRKDSYIIRHWKGDLSLAISYWVNGFLGRFAILITTSLSAAYIATIESDYMPAILWTSIWALIFAISIWQLVGIWRSAQKHIEKTKRRFWADAAKIMVVLGFISLASEFSTTGLPAIKQSLDRIALQKWIITILSNGSEVELTGGIGTGLAKDLDHILAVAPNLKLAHVNLTNGGLISEAKKTRDIIRQHHLNTYISSTCQSACTIVFLGGEKRYMRSGAKLGFHSPSFPGLSASDLSDIFRNEESYLKSLGLDPQFINKIFNTPADKMWFPTNDELLASGVVTTFTEGDEFGFSGIDHNIDSAKIEKILLSNRLFAAIRDKEPILYREMLEKLISMTKQGSSIEEARAQNAPKMHEMIVKYLPHSNVAAISDFARLMINQIDALANAPINVWYGYAIAGNIEATNVAYRSFPKSLRDEEADAVAAIIESADMAKPIPTAEQKNTAMEQLIGSLDESDAKLLGQMIQPNPAPNDEYCVVMRKLYDRALALPSYEKEIALHALLDR